MKLLFKLIEFWSWAWLISAVLLSVVGQFRHHDHTQQVTYCLLVFLAHRVYLLDLRLKNAGKRGW